MRKSWEEDSTDTFGRKLQTTVWKYFGNPFSNLNKKEND